MLAPHQQRVVDEQAQLDEKRAKLAQFLQGDLVKTLPDDEQERLQRQSNIMQDYSDVLSERIAAFVSPESV